MRTGHADVLGKAGIFASSPVEHSPTPHGSGGPHRVVRLHLDGDGKPRQKELRQCLGLVPFSDVKRLRNRV